MWIKINNEYLNLEHVVRVTFKLGWKNGKEELMAEVEGNVKGEIQTIARYRAQDAEVLQEALTALTGSGNTLVFAGRARNSTPDAPANAISSPTTSTVSDMQLPG